MNIEEYHLCLKTILEERFKDALVSSAIDSETLLSKYAIEDEEFIRREILKYAIDHSETSKLNLEPAECPPPLGMSFIAELLVTRSDREAVIGDLEELFSEVIYPKYGRQRALIWFSAELVKLVFKRFSLLSVIEKLLRLVRASK